MSRAVRSDSSPRVVPVAEVLPDGTIACEEAERAVISCLLNMSAWAAKAVTDTLLVEDFTIPQLRLVLEAVTALVAQQVAPDPVTVLGELRRTGVANSFTADREPGIYLADLMGEAPSVGSVGYYLRIVLDHAFRRRVQQAATRLAQASGSASLPVLREVLGDALVEMFEQTERLEAMKANFAAPPIQA